MKGEDEQDEDVKQENRGWRETIGLRKRTRKGRRRPGG